MAEAKNLKNFVAEKRERIESALAVDTNAESLDSTHPIVEDQNASIIERVKSLEDSRETILSELETARELLLSHTEQLAGLPCKMMPESTVNSES